MNLSPSLARRPSCSEVAFLEDLESHTVTPVNPNMYFLEERVKVHCKKEEESAKWHVKEWHRKRRRVHETRAKCSKRK